MSDQIPSTGTEISSANTESPSTTTAIPSTGAESPSATTEIPSTGAQSPTTGTESPTADTPAAPARAKTRRTRSLINKTYAGQLAIAGDIAAAAVKPEYAEALAAKGIDAAFIATLEAQIAEGGQFITDAGDKIAERKSATNAKKAAKAVLLELLGVIKARAKLKYPRLGDPQRARYCIGQKLALSRNFLSAGAQVIINHLEAGDLPDVTPAEVAALKAALETYRTLNTAQTDDQCGATTARFRCATKVAEVTELRRKLQYAAAWPATRATSAGIRSEFKLPKNRALK